MIFLWTLCQIIIASSISDLYSSNFRSNLVRWLKSIPYYPKPFDLVLQKHTELIKHLIDDFIDPDCYRQCLIDREENCLKERTHVINCDAEITSTQGQCFEVRVFFVVKPDIKGEKLLINHFLTKVIYWQKKVIKIRQMLTVSCLCILKNVFTSDLY